MSEPMSAEDREYMQRMTGAPTSTAPNRTHEQRVRMLLGWIVAFTGIVAAATVANFISGVVLTLSVTKPY